MVFAILVLIVQDQDEMPARLGDNPLKWPKKIQQLTSNYKQCCRFVNGKQCDCAGCWNIFTLGVESFKQFIWLYIYIDLNLFSISHSISKWQAPPEHVFVYWCRTTPRWKVGRIRQDHPPRFHQLRLVCTGPFASFAFRLACAKTARRIQRSACGE